MIYAGNHLSSSKGFEEMGKHIEKLGGNTFAFFTRNPRGGKAKAIDPADVQRFLGREQTRSLGPIVAHAPYTMNACAAKEDLRTFAIETMKDDMVRMEMIPGSYYNFHPGCHVGQGMETGIRLIADALNQIISPGQKTMILLETMAGKGTEVGGRFEELRAIMELVEHKEHVGVCLDTCHVFDAGYDIVNDLEGVFEEFDRVVGLEHLKAFHTNDSKNPMGSHKDRHETIGNGFIGKEAFVRFVNHPAVQGKPCILETPNEDPGWAEEIAFLLASAK